MEPTLTMPAGLLTFCLLRAEKRFDMALFIQVNSTYLSYCHEMDYSAIYTIITNIGLVRRQRIGVSTIARAI